MPLALDALDDVYELAGDYAMAAAGEYLDDNAATPSKKQSTASSPGRAKSKPMVWAAIERHRAELHGSPLSQNPRKRPHSISSGVALTVSNAVWRLVHDPKMRKHLGVLRPGKLVGPLRLDHLNDDLIRFDLADIALAITACTLIADVVRWMRRGVHQSTGVAWYQSSNSRILLAIYASDRAARLKPDEVLHGLGAVPASSLACSGSPGMSSVRAYDRAARHALARRLLRVVSAWCPADPAAMSRSQLARRALHWSEAALVQIWIWLGDRERNRHGRDDTPW
jgi:hypothetical protein